MGKSSTAGIARFLSLLCPSLPIIGFLALLPPLSVIPVYETNIDLYTCISPVLLSAGARHNGGEDKRKQPARKVNER
jgi:hypothetical protein